MQDNTKANLDTIYLPSENLLVKEAREELLIIPLRAGMVDMESEFFKISSTGRVMWDKLVNNKTLREISQEISLKYDAPLMVIEEDLLCLANELLERRMLVAVNPT